MSSLWLHAAFTKLVVVITFVVVDVVAFVVVDVVAFVVVDVVVFVVVDVITICCGGLSSSRESGD